MKARTALFAILLAASTPAWASYSEGFATFMLLYFWAQVSIGAVVVALVFCLFGFFKRTVVFAIYSALFSLGAAFVLLIAWFDTKGYALLFAISITLLLLAIVVTPGAVQYLFHRRKLRVPLGREAQHDGATLAEIMARNAATEQIKH